jgi:hypothetical protein
VARSAFLQSSIAMLTEALLSPLSSRPERSAVERSLCGCSYLEMFFLQSVPGFHFGPPHLKIPLDQSRRCRFALFAHFQMDVQQRERSRRHSGNSARLPQGLRPHPGQRFLHLP